LTREPVSENLVQTNGGSTNFLLDTSIYIAEWKLNGPIKLFAGQSYVDGIFTFPESYNWEIFDVAMYGGTMGSGGTTTFNILKASYGSGAFSTIFSTLPSISSSAGNGVSVHEGDVVSGCVAPVLTTKPFPIVAKDKLRLDVSAVQSGSPRNFGIRVYYRARN
jgi:hypothetical protein